MDRNVLETILKDELGAEQTDDGWRLPHGVRATVFLATGAAVFPVPKVDAVALRDTFVAFETDDGRVFTDLEQVVALRTEEDRRGRDGRLGFG